MPISLTFLGAAQTVTGSKYLLEAERTRVLVDCGLFQGPKELRVQNWTPLPIPAHTIDAVVLTHAHLDHTGYLPRLVRSGFHGKIYCTAATKELARLLLLDSARNQKRDAAHANRKGYSRHKPALPLYDTRDVTATLRRLRVVEQGAWFSPKKPIHMRMHDAGHLLGSSMIETEIRGRHARGGSSAPSKGHRGTQPTSAAGTNPADATDARPLRLLFSGDVGRYHAPLYFDPDPPPPCDILICEGTYGDRDHPEIDLLENLCRVMKAACRRGGVVLIAAFSVGRSQQLIYLLRLLIHQERLPEMPIFLDSPMAVEATRIYREHWAEHDLEEGEILGDRRVLEGAGFALVPTVEASKRLNRLAGPAVIISSSGMMTGGRILFHLKHRLPDPMNTVLISGFMVPGTRGAKLEAGAKWIRIHGQDVPVRAAVDRVEGLSGHADRAELLRWLERLPQPRRTFLTHGEPASLDALAETLRAGRGWQVTVPRLGERFELDSPSQ